MTPRAQARVDLDAITGNAAILRDRAAPAALLAVVKADGYGHGIVPAARAALAGGASWLGVAFIEEALTLRAAGVEARILCWMGTPGEPYADAVAASVDLSAAADWQVAEIAAAAEQAGRPARLHLEVDTGLSRGGAARTDWPRLLDAALAARAAAQVEVVGVWSHLARADEPGHGTVDRQLAAFGEATSMAHQAGLRPQLRHLANSPATLTAPQTHFDLVRAGIAVYGLCPLPGGPEAYGLRPAMTLSARLALVKRVPAGSGVSYGHRYVTDVDTTVGLVPLGYADGIPRHASNTAEVLAAGRRRRIAGTVCMDQFVIGLDDDPAAAGDEVVVFGPGDRGEPTAGDWAHVLGTIPYEIVSRVGARVGRTYASQEGEEGSKGGKDGKEAKEVA